MSDLEQGWDIGTNVGFTALAVAAVRAGETRRADRLIEDVWRWMSVMMAVTAWIGTQEFVSAINGEGNLDP